MLRRLGPMGLLGLVMACGTVAPTAVPSAPPSAAPSQAPPPTVAATNPPASVSGYAGTGWQATAQSFSGRQREQLTFQCPPNGVNWFIYGTDVYTSDSSVCTAAVHAGLITLETGGDVTIEIGPGQDAYEGSTRNDITSASYGPWEASFVFVGHVPPTQSPATARPTAVATSSGAPPSAPAPSASTVALDDDLVQPSTLVICSSFPRTRFAEYDSNGNPFGVDVEIGLALAEEMGLAPDVEEVAFEELIGTVASGGQCDVSIAGQFITSSRLEQIDMIPYREGAPHVIVRAGNPAGIDALDDLCGRRFAAVAGTVYVDMVRGDGDYAGAGIQDQCDSLQRPPVQLVEFTAQDEAEAALANGTVDAYAGNDFVTVEQPDIYELAVELPRARNGIGHRKGLAGLDGALRAALRAIIADGTYLQILDRYGAGDAALTITP